MLHMLHLCSSTSTAALLILTMWLGVSSCKQNEPNAPESIDKYMSIQGETMGTYYNVTYSTSTEVTLKPQIDSILIDINQSLSTYIPQSYISRLNASTITDETLSKDQHFISNYNVAMDIYRKSDGLYDPTIGALTNYYGFGKDQRIIRNEPSKKVLDSLKSLVGMDKIKFECDENKCHISRPNAHMQIDFSSIAKGYAVDQISKYLLSQGCKNHLVDIGGDGIAIGLSPSNKDWTIGINKPLENSAINEFSLVLSITNKGMATSGNYRNFYNNGTQKYAHTINPKSGLPEISHLLSASVIADNCMLADAYATTCMVMGLKKSKRLIDSLPGIEACWIHDTDQNGILEMTMSDGFKKFVQ